ncbi:MAG: asparagine synthase, partial [Candidatus Melainabacteria bacterium HGW-Melainabacteria-1]
MPLSLAKVFASRSIGDATLIRPPARGPLLAASRERDSGPIAGAIGLAPEQVMQLRMHWSGRARQLFEPGLVAESFACQVPGEAFVNWSEILQTDRLDAVNGAFALAWQQDDVLHLVRDAVGERTLFYAQIGQGLIFASTLDLLLAAGLIRPRLDREVLARYLSYAYVPGRESLLEGICELEPGEWLRFGAGQLHRVRWWQPAPEQWEPVSAEASLTKALRERIEAAVQMRMPAEGPICASLSGGVDSSLVVALLRRFYSGELLTFTVSFGAKYRNELPFGQCVATHCGTRHHVLEAHPKTVMHHFDETVALMGNPIGDPLTVPNALIYREASRYSGVLFNGEGGDPNFGGPKNIPMLLALIYGDPYHARRGESTYLRERTYLRSYRKLYEDLPELLGPIWSELPPDCLERQLAPWLDPAAGESFVQKLMALNTHFKGAHHILFKVNALSRAFGIQPASPLFDKQVTALALATPPQLKLKGTIEKYILKQAVADLLPERILHRPKSGMQVPVELWFRPGGPLHREARSRLRRLEAYDCFDPAYLR